MKLAQRLQDFRKSKNLSQKDLASIVGVDPVTVLRWETGTSSPSPDLATKLEKIGFGAIENHETKRASTPRIDLRPNDQHLFRRDITNGIRMDGNRYSFDPVSFVLNGPENQINFFNTLFELQDNIATDLPVYEYAKRLSVIERIPKLGVRPAQHELENPKNTAKHWNPNYGSHGWHRYIGRFPPHLVRALINHFGAKRNEIICDPFTGSGTTLVEGRLLGMKALGIEVCPLSAMIARTKSKFPQSTISLQRVCADLADFYKTEWNSFLRKNKELLHTAVIQRPGNLIAAFPNYEKWMTAEALLGSSLVVEFASRLQGYQRDAICCALSASMRRIGNLDVDVVRAEYRKKPRENVDVLSLVLRSLKNMTSDIAAMVRSHRDLISRSIDVNVIEDSLLRANVTEGSVDHIITSPPYGIESISYLRTHLLSYRCLEPILKYDPYTFDSKIIGSEYVLDSPAPEQWNATKVSATFNHFFNYTFTDDSKKFRDRKNMMMHFFEDMLEVAACFKRWLRPKGRIAFVVGNKRLGDTVIPTDAIIKEIFETFELRLDQSIRHKLKCNNSNSEVPWQERTIQDEFVLLFTNNK